MNKSFSFLVSIIYLVLMCDDLLDNSIYIKSQQKSTLRCFFTVLTVGVGVLLLK